MRHSGKVLGVSKQVLGRFPGSFGVFVKASRRPPCFHSRTTFHLHFTWPIEQVGGWNWLEGAIDTGGGSAIYGPAGQHPDAVRHQARGGGGGSLTSVRKMAEALGGGAFACLISARKPLLASLVLLGQQDASLWGTFPCPNAWP